jgi:hypothetical protein
MTIRHERPPPDVSAAARTGGSRKGLRESVTGQATRKVYANTRPYIVVVESLDRRAEWGRFSDESTAIAARDKLRRWGFDAHIVDAARGAP